MFQSYNKMNDIAIKHMLIRHTILLQFKNPEVVTSG